MRTLKNVRFTYIIAFRQPLELSSIIMFIFIVTQLKKFVKCFLKKILAVFCVANRYDPK